MVLPRRLALLAALIGSLVAAAPAHAIVGGSATASSSVNYPWQVAVLSTPGGDDDETWFCGGSRVAADLVLTAAHCVIDDDGRILAPGAVKVLSGHTNWHLSTFSQVEEVALYPDLDLQSTPSGMPSGDLALLQLPSAAPGEPIPVVGTEESGLWEPGDALRITGWGVTATSDQIQDLLRWANVPRIADDLCASAYHEDFLPTTMLCAGYATGGVDTCAGDSGGPIAVRAVVNAPLDDASQWRLVGATSWGSGCGDADFPGIYARLGEAPLRAFATDPEPTWSPVNVTAPSMPVSATVGDKVTCTPGQWSGADLTISYEFHRLDGATTLVQSGPSNTYTVTTGDTAGIVCIELAANEGGTAWKQSRATAVSAPVTPGPVVPDGVPDSQVPAQATPRTPVPGDVVTGQEVGTAADAASPRASRPRATCASRRCVISVRVSDPAPSSGIRRVTGTLRWKQACVRNGRRTTCTRSRRISARRANGTTWTLRTPRLPRGRASISIVAVDRSGRMQSSPARLTFRVR